MKNKLPYVVTGYNICGEPTSSSNHRTERDARKSFDARVVSAGCANVGRITFYYYNPINFFGRVVEEHHIAEWVRPVEEVQQEPEQEATYIVHSVKTIGNCKQSTFNRQYSSEKAAVAAAKRVAEYWSSSHPGALVFKAVKHVKRVSARRAGVTVTDLGEKS